MRPYQSSDLTPERAQVALLARLHGEIQHRRETDWRLPDEAEAVVPGDELVTLAGKLYLLASPELRATYEQTLWPLVQASLGVETPGPLIRGNFLPYVLEARRLLESPEPLRLAARSTPSTIPSLALRQQEELETLLVARLEAGCFLTGLEVLWREPGPAAARTLWREGLVQAWDQVLRESRKRLAPAAEMLRRALVESFVPLEGPWFEGVRWMVGAETGVPAVAPQPTGANRQEADRQLVHLALLEEWLGLEQERDPAFDGCTVYPQQDRSLAIVRHRDGGEVLIWFATEERAAITLPRASLAFCNALIGAEAIRIQGVAGDEDEEDAEDDQDDQGVWLLRFIGAMDGAGLAGLQRGEEGEVRLERSAFSGGHDQAVALMVVALSSAKREALP